MKYTSIRLSERTKEDLAKQGRKGDSFEKIIKDLLGKARSIKRGDNE